MAYERSSGCFSLQREKNHAQWTYFMCDMMYLISTKEVVAKRSAHDDLTKHIRAHLIAAKHEKFADDYDGRPKWHMLQSVGTWTIMDGICQRRSCEWQEAMYWSFGRSTNLNLICKYVSYTFVLKISSKKLCPQKPIEDPLCTSSIPVQNPKTRK